MRSEQGTPLGTRNQLVARGRDGAQVRAASCPGDEAAHSNGAERSPPAPRCRLRPGHSDGFHFTRPTHVSLLVGEDTVGSSMGSGQCPWLGGGWAGRVRCRVRLDSGFPSQPAWLLYHPHGRGEHVTARTTGDGEGNRQNRPPSGSSPSSWEAGTHPLFSAVTGVTGTLLRRQTAPLLFAQPAVPDVGRRGFVSG